MTFDFDDHHDVDHDGDDHNNDAIGESTARLEEPTDETDDDHGHQDHDDGGDLDAEMNIGRLIDAPGDDFMGRPHPEHAHRDFLGDREDSSDGGGDLGQFDPERHGGADLVGTPAEDMERWHQQNYFDSCVVSCEEFILDGVSGRDFTEQDLVRESRAHEWYKPEHGTPELAVGNLLKQHDVPISRTHCNTLDDITDSLEHGEKVIVSLRPGAAGDEDQLLSETGGIPTHFARHAVQVIGIKGADTDHPVVILNDPGRPDGAGRMVSGEAFEQEWAFSGHFMARTAFHDPETSDHDWGSSSLAANEQSGHDHGSSGGPRLGSWEKWPSGYMYEKAPDGSYTGNRGT